MSARFNSFMDSIEWRIAVNVAGFSAWLAAAYGLMQLALAQ